MRIAVLSDIHANLAALERVLDDCQDADAVWTLGDLVGYGPRPDEVIQLLRDRGAMGVSGNHDAAVVGLVDTVDFNDDAAAAANWTSRIVTPETREYLTDLPKTLVIDDCTLVHGSPREPFWEYLVSTAQARENLLYFSTRVCLFGHTHLPSMFFSTDSVQLQGVYAEVGTTLDISGELTRVFLNPGSVGQPRDGDPRASYMMLDLDAQTATWRRVAYPIATTQDQMREIGLPPWLIERLPAGR